MDALDSKFSAAYHGPYDERTHPSAFAPPPQAPVPPGGDDVEDSPLGKKISAALQYLYFLRFPILGWLFLPALCLIDATTGLSTITRGIMTMSRTWQAFYAAFFIAALMNTVLICAKNILRNGPCRFSPDDDCTRERIRTENPGWLRRTINDSTTSTMLRVLFVAHIPALITLAYIGVITHREGETNFEFVGLGLAYWHMWLGFAMGLICALVFWYGVSIFYLWVYPNWPEGHDRYHKPNALLLPMELPGMDKARAAFKPRVANWAAWALRPLVAVSHVGYAESKDGTVWEFHTLALVALTWFLTLYLFLYPLTAPVVLSRFPVFASTLAFILLIVLLLGTGDAKIEPEDETQEQDEFLEETEEPEYASSATTEPKPSTLYTTHEHEDEELPEKNPGRVVVYAMRIIIVATFLVFVGLLSYNAYRNTVLMENAFPVLASVLVIMIFLQWFLSGASFFFDRFRVPVLAAVLLFLVGSKFLLQWVDQDHYFEARDTERVDELDSPQEAMSRRMNQHPDQPYIIVTATGGGIQAAEWTAQVMALMEKRFRDDADMQKAGYTFHDHLLLASGVSGGSVGLMPYLLEYTTPLDKLTSTPAPMFLTHDYGPDGRGRIPPDLLTRRLTLAPGCSSLEAVAWGLEYYDLQQLLFTISILPKVRDEDLRGANSSAPDRTWALTESFNRNFSDRDCGTDPQAQAENEKFSQLPKIESGRAATLRTSAHRLHLGAMPAFTFNTTVAETGGRFLLSNYAVQPPPPQTCNGRCEVTMPGTEFLPAESFLQAYASESNCDLAQVRSKCYADISLSTAARLSATFPAVSSATRVPKRYAERASHFVDGGYFDNDGTGSVTEFLLNALRQDAADTDQAKKTNTKPASPQLPAGPLRILLVEIRDGDDMDPTQNADDLGHQTGKSLAKYADQPKPWTTLSQLMAPLEGMWEAGHESITRRNRRELCILSQAYSTRLEIHHVVLGIPSAQVEGEAGHTKTAPLNWKLTAEQRQYIENWATAPDKPTQASITSALNWVKGNLPGSKNPSEAQAPCTINDQTYMRSDMR